MATDYDLTTKTKRSKLAPKKEPYWCRLGGGVSIGYRRPADDAKAGTWVGRQSTGDGGRAREFAIGLADDLPPAKGYKPFTYAQASTRAQERPTTAEERVVSPWTIEKVIDEYAKTKSDKDDNIKRLSRHAKPILARIASEMTRSDFEEWRKGLKKGRRGDNGTGNQPLDPASVNRVTSLLKAALNHAMSVDESQVTDERTWKLGAKAMPGAANADNVVLHEDSIRALVKAGLTASPEFALLLETHALTGARTVQLASLRIRDLISDGDRHFLAVPPSAKGRPGKGRPPALIEIPKGLASRLAAAAKDRPKDAPLLLRTKMSRRTKQEIISEVEAPAPKGWGKNDHSRPFATVLKTALPKMTEADQAKAKEITIYALRHSHITDQILRGVPIRLVAALHDTSVAMIEKHYSAAIATTTSHSVMPSWAR